MKPTNLGLETLLSEAVEIMDANERDAYLRKACGSDGAKLAELQSMVRDYFAAGPFVDRPAAFASTVTSDSTTNISLQIGPYKLRELLGEGGMGRVYVAEQDTPVRRKVALKIIKPGMGSREVIARFESERQALALMDHPNIARVLDAGTTDSGLPYFVMELIKGAPITDYCDGHRLKTRDRLELFLQVCQAVQHAHQKGIIHRDLKPSNIMVAIHDTTPVVKVIDFGVAKAIGQQLTDNTLYTAFSQMIGTPLYMSPEQAGQNALDIDTRSDVYSLGVMLYELLTGNTPFDSETLKKAGIDEMRRIIREVDPPKPSARFSTLNDLSQSAIAQKRSMDSNKFSRQFRGEIDWIVMKAIEKDRNRRYETASSFARDIQNFLSGETVEARPPSTAYRMHKFAVRNKGVLAGSALMTVVLLVASIISIWQAIVATTANRLSEQRYNLQVEAEKNARSESQRSLEASIVAQQATERAIAESEVAEGINQFLAEELLGQASPDRTPVGDQLTMLEALNRASHRIEIAFPAKPKLKIAIHKVIGDAFHSLGEYEKCIDHFLAALNQNGNSNHLTPPEKLNLQVSLGRAYTSLGQWPEAEKILRRSLEQSLATVGLEHSSTFNAMSSLLELAQQREDSKTADDIERRLGAEYAFSGQNMDSLTALAEMCHGLAKSGMHLFAQEILQKAIAVSETQLGIDNSHLLSAKMNLGVIRCLQGANEDGEALLREALVGYERLYGYDHSKTMMCELRLAECLATAKKFAEAEMLLNQYYDQCQRVMGVDHPNSLNALTLISKVVCGQDRHREATQMLRSNLVEIRTKRGDEHLSAITVANELAIHLLLQGNFLESERLAKENLVLAKKHLGMKHSQTGRAVSTIDTTLIAQRKHAESRAFGQANLETFFEVGNLIETSNPPNGSVTMLTTLAEKALNFGSLNEAEMLLRLALVVSQNPNLIEPPLSKALTQVLLGRTLMAAKRFNEAEKAIRKGLDNRRRSLPVDHFLVAETESILGECLTLMNRMDEAEPLHLNSWIVLENADQFSVFQKAESLNRTIQHFEKCESANEVQRWAKQLEVLLKNEIQSLSRTGPADKTTQFELVNQLGGCLTTLGRFDEAQQVLEENYIELSSCRYASLAGYGMELKGITKDTCMRFAELRKRQGIAIETEAWTSLGNDINHFYLEGVRSGGGEALDSAKLWTEIASGEHSTFLDHFNLALSYRLLAERAAENNANADSLEWYAKSLRSLTALLVRGKSIKLTEMALGSCYAGHAKMLLKLGRIEDAWSDLEQALIYSKQEQEVVLVVSDALCFLSEPEWRMEGGFERRTATNIGESPLLDLLAAVQYRAGKLESARQTLEKNLTMDPMGTPLLWLLMAGIEADLGNSQQSRQAIDKADVILKRGQNSFRDPGIAWLRTLVDKSLKGESRIKLSEKTTQSQLDGVIRFTNVFNTLKVADSPSFKLTSSLSIEAWLMLSSCPERKAWIFFRGDNRGGLDPYELFVDESGHLKFSIHNGKQSAQVATPFQVPTEQLLHVTGTLNDSRDEMSLYINGVMVDQIKTTIRPFGELDPGASPEILIAQQMQPPFWETKRSFYCVAEQLCIYDRALSADEVLANYNSENRQMMPTISILGTTVTEGKAIAKSLGRFVAERSGGLARPRGMTFGPDGNADGYQDLYVTSADTDSILRFDGDTGQFLDEFVARGEGGLDGPIDLLFDAQGNLFVTSQDSNQLLQYSSAGRFSRVVASNLNKPNGISLGKDGSLFVSNVGANQVLKFHGDSVAIFLREGVGGLKDPRHAIIGPDGDLYVANSSDSSVLKFDSDTGEFKGIFAKNPLQTGMSRIEFGQDGFLYATYRTNLATSTITLARFNSTTGDFVESFPLDRDGWSFIIGPDKLIYNASNGGGNNVERLMIAPAAELSVSLSNACQAPLTVQFETADGTAISGQDYLTASGILQFEPGETRKRLFVDILNNHAQRETATFVVNLTNSKAADTLISSATVTIKDNDAFRFYVLDDRTDRDQVFKYAEGGKSGGKDPLANKNSKPRGIAQQDEQLWTVDADRNVVVYDTAMNSRGAWMAKTTQNKAKVEGIAVHDRDIWIVDNLTDCVYVYVNATDAVSGIKNANGMFPLDSLNSNPKDITTDGVSIWVVDDGTTDRVFKYSLDGALLGSWSIDLANASPTGIAVDRNSSGRRIWIVDNGLKRVFEYTGGSETDSGSLQATASFMLEEDNVNPQSITKWLSP